MNRAKLAVLAILLTGLFTSSLWAQAGNQEQSAREERLNALVADLEEEGDFETAARYQQELVTSYQNRLGREHVETLQHLNYLGLLQTQSGDHTAAQRNLEECWNIRRRLLGEDHADTGQVRFNLGLVAQNLGDNETAKQHYRSALTIFRAQLGENHESTTQTLHNFSLLYTDDENYEKAEEFAAYVLKQRRQNLGNDHADTGQALLSLGYIYDLQQNLSAAREHYNLALAIFQKQLGPQHDDTLQTLINLALLEEDLGNLDKAHEIYTQVYTVRRNKYGAEHVGVGEVLYRLCINYYQQGDLSAARDHCNRALVIFRKQLGPEHEDTLQALDDLATLDDEMGNFAQAHEFHNQLYTSRLKIFGPEHVDVGNSLHNLAFSYQRQGNYTAAREHYNRALAIFEKQYGRLHVETLQTLNNLGLLEHELSNFAKAHQIHMQVYTNRLEKLGPEHEDVGESLLNLGYMSHDLGDLTQARTHYEEGLRIYLKTYGPEHPYTLDIMNNLGNLYEDLGDFPAARKYHTQVLEMREKRQGAEHADKVSSLVNLGRIAFLEDNNAEARTFLEQAARIAKKQLGDEHPTTLQTMSSLVSVLHEQGEYEAAETLMRQTLANLQKVLGDHHPAVGEALFSAAWFYHDSGDFPRARECYQQSLAIFEAKLGNEHTVTQTVVTAWGILEAVDGNSQESVRLVDLARRSRRSSLSRLLSGMSPAEQLKFVSYDDGFPIALTLGLRHDDDQTVVDASAGWLINGKGVSQESLAARELLTRDVANPQAKKFVEQLLEVRRKLAQLVVSIPAPNQKDARKEAIDELTQTELKRSRDLAQLVGESTNLGQWAELDEIRAALATDEVLINLALFEPYDIESERKSITDRSQPPHYAAWIIPATTQGEIQIVDLGLAERFDQQVEVIRQAMGQAGKADGPLSQQQEFAAEEQFREASQQLSDALWQPLAERLPAEARHLTISPDGALWLLPWAALPVAAEKYLIEDYTLRFVISGRELIAADNQRASSSPLLFANPAFDLRPDAVRAAVKAIFRDVVFGENAQRGLVSQTTLGRVSPLPGTLLEAEAISPSVERITGKRPVKYLGQYALESVVKRVKSPKVMVLSTHGYFLQDQQMPQSANRVAGTRSSAWLTAEGKPVENPLLRCGLLFAGCNSPSSGIDDGILTGMEIVGLDLRGTDLVVLSACETGTGKVQTGEGVAGLRQAFQLAGAKGVVSTLWQVPDRDSAILMRDFFENLANDETQPEALRHAQLQRIESRRQRYGAAHPFFWAAWTLTGK